MRMTNEEFEAEVFRRSRVYMQARQVRRRRLMTGAAAFAGCFVLLTAGAVILPHRNKFSMMNNEIAVRDSAVADGADYGADSSAAFAEEAAEEAEMFDEEYKAGAGDDYGMQQAISSNQKSDQPAHGSKADSAEVPKDAISGLAPEESSEAESAESFDKDTVPTAKEICESFGIPVPPGRIADFREAYDPAVVGINHDELLCRYENEHGKLSFSVTHPGDYDREHESGEISYYSVDPKIKSASFSSGKAQIIIELESDDPDADAILQEAAEALKDYLSR